MKVFDSYELLITPLSPVHIGTGESYEPTNYIIERDTLYEFDTGSVLAALGEGERNALLAKLNGRPNQEMIKAVQKFFHDQRQSLIAYAVHRIPVLDGVAALYRSRVGTTAQREVGGRQVINRLEIDRTAFDSVARRPVLFGSSLKGAIRTALLDMVNSGQSTHDKKGLHDFQGRLFGYRDGRLALDRDPMRLVQISDATWRGESGLPAAEVHFAVNRKKAPVVDKDGKLRPSQAEQRGLYQILECVPAMRYRAFAGQVNIQRVNGAATDERFPDPAMRFDMRRIAEACNAFYRPLLREEDALLSGRGYASEPWRKAVEEILGADAERKMERGELFLMRVGRHSGAEAMTLRGVRQIKIMKGKGEKELASSSKTIWLAAERPDQRGAMLPFGWLLVEVCPTEARPAADWDALKSICDSRSEPGREWASRQAEVDREREVLKAEQQARKLHDVEDAKRRAAAEARAVEEEAERQQRLAAMTPLERSMQDALDAERDRSKRTHLVLLEHLRRGTWTGDDAKLVANRIMGEMKAERVWKESSTAKKPEKDKDYQRTLEVTKYLE